MNQSQQIIQALSEGRVPPEILKKVKEVLKSEGADVTVLITKEGFAVSGSRDDVAAARKVLDKVKNIRFVDAKQMTAMDTKTDKKGRIAATYKVV